MGGGITWAALWTGFLVLFSGANGLAISTLIVTVAGLWSAAHHDFRWLAGSVVCCGVAMAAANILQTAGI
jgi:hypothetical protein